MKSLKKAYILVLLFSLQVSPFVHVVSFSQAIVKQGNPVPAKFCIDDTVLQLYRMINGYRASHDLPPIPLSKSLSYVAGLHAKDLYLHHPDRGGCSSYSWSDKGLWKPFCYPRDENKKSSVWDKPRELTKYPAKAYEIVYWENNPLLTDTIMMVWKTEEFFNSFLLNEGKWQGKSWNAIGISVFENYACAWFGEVADPEGVAYLCGSLPEKPKLDSVLAADKPVLPDHSEVKVKKQKTVKAVPVKKDSLATSSPDTLNPPPAPHVPTNENVQVPKKDTITGTYYIIVKTNLTLKAANTLADTLRSTKYPGAKVLDQDGKIRVSVFDSQNKASTMTSLKEVKKIYKDAWLMKK